MGREEFRPFPTVGDPFLFIAYSAKPGDKSRMMAISSYAFYIGPLRGFSGARGGQENHTTENCESTGKTINS